MQCIVTYVIGLHAKLSDYKVFFIHLFIIPSSNPCKV